jgi:hypothetical protein
MFNQDRGATRSYRTLARGRGGGWVRAYQAAQLALGSQRPSPQRLEMPIRAATMPTATIASPASAIAQRSASRPAG